MSVVRLDEDLPASRDPDLKQLFHLATVRQLAQERR